MEIKIKQLKILEEQTSTLGGWHTQISLSGLGWTPYHDCTCIMFALYLRFLLYITAIDQPQNSIYVYNTCMHLREMISNAKEWATRRGLVRTNEVHGADEFRVPTESSFSFTETTRKEEEKSGGFEVEDPQGTLLDFSDLTAQNAISQLVFI